MMHMASEHLDPELPDIWFGQYAVQPTLPEDLRTNLRLAFPLPAMDVGADARFGLLLDSLHRVHAVHF